MRQYVFALIFQYVIASDFCEAISLIKQGIASTGDHRLAMIYLELLKIEKALDKFV